MAFVQRSGKLGWGGRVDGVDCVLPTVVKGGGFLLSVAGRVGTDGERERGVRNILGKFLGYPFCILSFQLGHDDNLVPGILSRRIIGIEVIMKGFGHGAVDEVVDIVLVPRIPDESIEDEQRNEGQGYHNCNGSSHNPSHLRLHSLMKVGDIQ